MKPYTIRGDDFDELASRGMRILASGLWTTDKGITLGGLLRPRYKLSLRPKTAEEMRRSEWLTYKQGGVE